MPPTTCKDCSARALPGRARCAACLERRRAEQKAIVFERKLLGLCVVCEAPVVRHETTGRRLTVCAYHREYYSARTGAYRSDKTEGEETTMILCECGKATGVRCAWEGPADETVVVEWMPEHLRASHTAARNSGTYPHNGALRLTMHRDCARELVASDPEWTHEVNR